MAKKIPLHVMLAVQFSAQVIGLVSVVGYLSYQSGQRAVEALAHQLMAETSNRVTLRLDNFLSQPHRINQIHSSAVTSEAIRLQDLDQLHRYLIHQLRQFPEATTFLFGTPQGDFRLIHHVSPEEFSDGVTRLAADDLPFEAGQSNPDDPSQVNVYSIDENGNLLTRIEITEKVDVRNRPWYRQAIETRQPGWSQPFQIGASNLLGLNAYRPIFNHAQELEGVFSVNVSLGQLNAFLETLRIGQTGQAFIIDENGLLVANSVGERPYTTSVQEYSGDVTTSGGEFRRLAATESSNPLMQMASQTLHETIDITNLDSRRPEHLAFQAAGDRHFLRVMPYADEYGLDWRIVTVVPQSDFMGEIHANVRRTVWLCGLALVGAIASGVWTSRRITKSLSRLTQATQDFAAGNPIQIPDSTSIQEVATLSTSFHQMINVLKDAEQLRQNYAQELEQQVAARVAALNEAQRIARVGSWEIDVATQAMMWSEELYRIYEAPPQAPVDRPDLTIQRIHPDDHERYQRDVVAAITAQQPFDVDLRILTQNDNIRYIQTKGQPIFNPQGEVIKLAGTVADITDRKHAEVSFQTSEQRYASLAAAAPVGIFRTDAAGHCIYVNHRWCQIAGLTPDEAKGEGWVQGLHPDDRDRVSAEWYQSAQDNRPFQLEYRFQPSNSLMTWVYGQSVAERDTDGQIIGYVGTITDISERKQLEVERLQAEQIRNELTILEEILNTVLSGYWDWHIPNHRQYLSPGLKRMFGYSDDELPNTPESLQNLILPEDVPRMLECFERHVQSRGTVPYYNEIRYRHKNGSTMWVISSGQVIEWDADDNPLRMVGCHIDISDRKQLELAVQDSQKKLSEVLDTAISGIIRLRFYPDTLIQYDYISPHCEKIFGYTVDELMPDAKLWQSRIHPDDWETIIVPAMQAILNQRNTSTHVIEYRFHRKDDSICWILANIFVQWNEFGQHWTVTVVDTDISDRKRTEDALRASEARWQFALEGAGDGVWDWNTQTNIVFYSRQWKAMLGYADHEVGNTLEEWENRVHPGDKDQCYAQLNRHFSGETPVYQNEHRIRCKDGSYKWILARGQVIERTAEGQPLRVLGTHTDTTDRKLAEQKIREQATLIDIAPAAISVRDLENRLLFWNQGAEQLYGWAASEAVGQLASNLFARNIRAEFDLGLKTTLEQGFWQGELVQTTKAGNKILVASRWTLVRDTSGHPQSLLVVNTDITEKKQLEAQFYQAQRLDSLGQLASGIAHDLNNVLTPILTMAQLLRLTQSHLGEPVQEQIKLLEDSAKRGADMVKQILTFTRGSDGARMTVNLVPLLQDIATIAQQSFPKSIEISQNFPSSEHPDQSLGVVSVDPTHVHQVLMNLCINARDAMPRGGILTLSAENVSIDDVTAHIILDAKPGHYVVITVADTGIGIAPEVRDRMFEPFFTTKEIGQGTGLGLATVLGIIKNYGGFVQVFSEVGQGTHVKVYLPIIEEPLTEPSQPETHPDAQRNGQGELILIVDDDGVMQRSTQTLLESHDYATVVASDGIEAMARYTQHQHDIRLVVVDVMMPTMGGIPLIQRLKTMDPMLKIIAISGLRTNREPVLASGADVFLTKPYSLETLLENIGDLINNS